MSKLSERIAADVLKASGSGLQNYTMNGSRERIIAAAAGADDLLEALQFYANSEIYKPHPHGPAFDDRDLSFRARAAIAKATGAAS